MKRRTGELDVVVRDWIVVIREPRREGVQSFYRGAHAECQERAKRARQAGMETSVSAAP